jgi:hypothetical protein
MMVQTSSQVKDSFRRFPRNSEYVHCDDEGLFFTNPESTCIELKYPSTLERLPFFASLLAQIGYEPQDFQGSLIWIKQWGIWNLADEGVGYEIVEQMHTAAGQPQSFEVGTGHSFRADEFHKSVGMLLQPMIFGWDAYYLGCWSYGTDQFFLHVSHDSYVSLVTRTHEFHQKVFAILEGLKLGPQPATGPSLQRFCRQERSL